VAYFRFLLSDDKKALADDSANHLLFLSLIETEWECYLMPKESEVEGLLRKHLKDHGYKVEERTSKHGVDITAFKDAKKYYVEIEGDTKPDGEPFTTSQKYTHLLRAVGQICLRMNNDPNGVYEIVLAEDPYYREKIDELQIALKRLGVATYFVNEEDKISRVNSL